MVFSTDDTPGDRKRIKVSVFDGQSWSQETRRRSSTIVTEPDRRSSGLDLDANNSTGGGADATATFTSGGPAISVTDTDVSITADAPAITSATITILGWSLHAGDELSAGTLPTGITASSYNPFTGVITLSGEASLADYQTALRQVVFDTTSTSTADRGIQMTVTDSSGLISNLATMYMHVVSPPPNVAPVIDLDANNSTTTGANYLTGFTEGGPPVAIADTDILIIDPDDPSLASATITLTNPQTGDVLILRWNAATRHRRFGLRHNPHHDHGRRVCPPAIRLCRSRSNSTTATSILQTSRGPSRSSSVTAPATATPQRRLSRLRR